MRSIERASVRPPFVVAAPRRATLRRLLDSLLRTEDDFHAFCIDHVPAVHTRFVHGMDRVARVNLLLELTEPAQLLEHLLEHFSDDASGLATIEHFLGQPETQAERQSREQWNAAEDLYIQREQLRQSGQSTDAIDKEIVSLRRTLRQALQLGEGELLKDRYRLIAGAGHGGFAKVWKAFDRKSRGLVAIKVLHAHQGEDPRRVERFERGARQMQRLTHPHIVRVLDGPDEHREFHYFVMQYLEGGDLYQAVVGRLLDRDAALRAVVQVGDALAYASQQGIVHRDVKPQNILLDRHGHGYLTDFDLVWAADTTGNTRTGFLGTHVYAAPEQAEDAKSVDHRADVYSLGMTALFVLHGGPLPQQAVYQREQFIARLACPDSVKVLLLRAIAIDRTERPETARDFCAELVLAFNLLSAAAPLVIAEASQLSPPAPIEPPLIAEHVQLLALGPSSQEKRPASLKPTAQSRRWPGFLIAASLLLALLVMVAVVSWLKLRAGELLAVVEPPSELTVLVDGKPQPGSTSSPLHLRLAPGQHEVTVQHADHTSWQGDVAISAGQETLQHIRLAPIVKPTGGFTLISDPPGASVLLDGVSLGQVTPIRVQSVLAGPHSLELKLGRRTHQQQINIKPDQNIELRIPMPPSAETPLPPGGPIAAPADPKLAPSKAPKSPDAPKPAKPVVLKSLRRPRVPSHPVSDAPPSRAAGNNGYLRINSRPWTKIIVDGLDTGLNTPQFSYRVNPGTHTVTLVNPQFGIKESISVTVRAGETQSIQKTFKVSSY